GEARVGDELLAVHADGQAALHHGGEVRPPGDQRHVHALARQQPPDPAAHRAGPEDAELHGYFPSPSFSASPIPWILPVAPFGISERMTTLRGTLKAASLPVQKSRRSRSETGEMPSTSTTAAATSSPSRSCGIAKVQTCATAG